MTWIMIVREHKPGLATPFRVAGGCLGAQPGASHADSIPRGLVRKGLTVNEPRANATLADTRQEQSSGRVANHLTDWTRYSPDRSEYGDES